MPTYVCEKIRRRLNLERGSARSVGEYPSVFSREKLCAVLKSSDKARVRFSFSRVSNTFLRYDVRAVKVTEEKLAEARRIVDDLIGSSNFINAVTRTVSGKRWITMADILIGVFPVCRCPLLLTHRLPH